MTVPGCRFCSILDLQHVLPAAVKVDVKDSKKKGSVSVKVDGMSRLAHTQGAKI